MTCGVCGGATVRFAVPEDLCYAAPKRSEAAEICASCLTVEPVQPIVDGDPGFDPIIEGFPSQDAGIAMALALGLLVESVALHRQTVGQLFDRVHAEGFDPWLVLERLAVTPTVDPGIDLLRAKRQLEQLRDTD